MPKLIYCQDEDYWYFEDRSNGWKTTQIFDNRHQAIRAWLSGELEWC